MNVRLALGPRSFGYLLGFWLGLAACQKRAVEESQVSGVQPRQPSLRLFVITDLAGTLEPCGCHEGSLGGMDRLVHVVHQARTDGVPDLVLSAGSLYFAEEERQDESFRARTVADVLALLPLAASAPGSRDLAKGRALLGELAARSRTRLLAAGTLFEEEPTLGARTAAAFEHAGNMPIAPGMSLELKGLKIGLVGLVAHQPHNGSTVAMMPNTALNAAAERARERRAQGANLVVGLVTGTAGDANMLAERGELDLTVLGGNGTERSEPQLVARPVLSAGARGERVLVVDLWLDTPGAAFQRWTLPEAPPVAPHRNWIRWRSEELSRHVQKEAKSRQILESFAKQVNTSNRSQWEHVQPRPATEKTGGYVGSRPCASCHTAAYLWWTRSAHGQAYQSLTEVSKEYHLDCVGCHVTGYDQPGGSTVTHVEGLTNVGCESCHGPGSAHVADTRPPFKHIHKEVAEGLCRSCHTPEHSAPFDFNRYRERLLAPGHGLSM